MSCPDTEFAPIFAALGDATRIALVSRLLDGRPQCIAQLADGMGQTRQGVSKHLRVLEQAGIVSSRKIGRESRFLLRRAALVEARDYLSRVSEQWDEAINRLTMFVEEN